MTGVWSPTYFDKNKNALHYILDGWTAAPIFYASSGAPYTGFINGSLPGSGSLTGTSTLLNTVCFSTHNGGLNCASGQNRVPNIARNAFRMPRRWYIDMRIGREFGFGPAERYKFEFI